MRPIIIDADPRVKGPYAHLVHAAVMARWKAEARITDADPGKASESWRLHLGAVGYTDADLATVNALGYRAGTAANGFQRYAVRVVNGVEQRVGGRTLYPSCGSIARDVLLGKFGDVPIVIPDAVTITSSDLTVADVASWQPAATARVLASIARGESPRREDVVLADMTKVPEPHGWLRSGDTRQ